MQVKAIFKNSIPRGIARKRLILENIPTIWDYKTMLYIGASCERFDLIEMFEPNGFVIDVLEAWEKNINCLERVNKKWKIFRKIILGRAENIDDYFGMKAYDVIVWHHGPEHITQGDLPGTLRKIEWTAKHIIILGCPHGRYDQGPIKGNPFEKHLSHLVPEDFERLGYKTATIRKIDKRGSHILAWKLLD